MECGCPLLLFREVLRCPRPRPGLRKAGRSSSLTVFVLLSLLQAEKLMRQIGVKNVKLSEYEMSIAAHLVDPLSMQVLFTFSQSGGRMTARQHEGGRWGEQQT